MRQLSFVLAICVSFAGASYGQIGQAGACPLNVSQLPAIRGLRLGMDQSEVLRVFPGSQGDPAIKEEHSPRHLDAASLQLLPNYGTPAQFSDVSQLLVTFYHEKLVQFTLVYLEPNQGGVRWRNRDEFISKVAESLQLPGPQAWGPGTDPFTNSQTLNCDGFQVHAQIGSLTITNPSYLPDLEARRAAAEEEKRRTFHP